MLDQFHPICHPYIVNVVDVVVDGYCGYICIAALLGMSEDLWPLIRLDQNICKNETYATPHENLPYDCLFASICNYEILM